MAVEVNQQEFGRIVKRFVDREGSAKINFSHNEKFACGQEYDVKRAYSFEGIISIVDAKYDKEDLREVTQDCIFGIVGMLSPYGINIEGNTAIITPPKRSLDGLAGEQFTLF